MNSIIRFVIRNKLAVWLLTIIVAISGIYAGTKMKQELLPDISIPYVLVFAVYPGASPDQVMEEVSIPLEQALEDLKGVKTVYSSSFSNMSSVQVEFEYGTDMENAERQIRNAIDGLELPEAVMEPTITRMSMNIVPVAALSISSEERDVAALTALVEEVVVPGLKKLAGVANVDVAGQHIEKVLFEFDRAKMAELGVTEQTVRQVIQANDLTLPLGLYPFEEAEQAIVVSGEADSVRQLEELLIPVTPTAERPVPFVQLKEIARLEPVGEVESISRTNGATSIGIQITKSQEANTVEVVNRVKELAEDLMNQYSGLTIDVTLDQGQPIEESIATMVSKALFGAGFAILVILLFLRDMRSTIISVLSIPLSILIALLALRGMDISLNIMTLGAMTVAIGRVIDDSIVVVENIYRRLRLKSEPLRGRELIRSATIEMFRPILSSTLVTVAVFAPLVFVGGMVGELFLPFALTMAFALGASLLVAITVVPSLSHTLFRKQLMRRAQANTGAVEGGEASAERETSAEPGTSAHRETSGAASAPFDPARYARLDAVIHAAREAADPAPEGAVLASAAEGDAAGEGGSSAGGRNGAKAAKEVLSRTGKYGRGRSGGGHEGLGVLARAYKRMLAWALRHKAATFSGAVVLLAASLFLLPAVGISFIDYNASEKMMYFTYTPAKGEDPETTNAQVAVAEELMMARDDVRVVQISIGSGGNPMAAMLGGGTDGALMFVAFDPDTRHFDRVTEEVTEQITSLEATGAWKVQDFASMGFSSDEMSYTVYGHDLDSVEQAVRQIEKIMRQAENITDVSSSLSDAYVQQTLHVDANKAMQVGLTTAQIAMMLNPNRTEDVLTTIRKDGRNVRVVVRQEVDTAKTIERLLDRQIPTPAGVTVRLGDLVQVEEDLVASRLDRSAGRYYASVSGKITSRDVSAASREVDEKIRSLQLPDGVELGESGVIADIEETFTQLGVAMAVAVLIVYFILVVTFGEGLAPFAILFSLPFVAIGSLAGLWLAGETLSVTAMMGLLMLIGIVVTNAIVLVDRIIRKEREGLDIREAILEAGATRLRPILMTALATVGALLPLVIGAEGGAGFISRGLAVTVIGGLTSSTLLTLVIVPIVYEWLSKVFRKRRNAPEMI